MAATEIKSTAGQATAPNQINGSVTVHRTAALQVPRPLRFLPDAGVIGRTSAKVRRHKRFYLMVVLPTVVTAIYMYVFAANQYISEAHFIVRSGQKQSVSGLGALLQSAGVGGVRDDSAAIIDFIKSRDGLREIDQKIDYRAIVGRDEADFFARYPNFYTRAAFETLYEYYTSIVSVTHDAQTGIATLKVRAFTPEDSHKVAESLLDASENMINRMNDRSLKDAVSLADREVKIAEQRSAQAQNDLTAFRISAGIIDSTSSSKSALELIASLERELASSKASLQQARVASPNSPALPSLRDRTAALEGQVAEERGKLLGKDGALVGTFGTFQRLTLEAEFAAKAVMAANTMLESARIEALRKQLYLERVVEPNTADLSRYPKRFLSVLTVAGTAMLAYLVLWLLVLNAREHTS